jgi:hypothetical protein
MDMGPFLDRRLMGIVAKGQGRVVGVFWGAGMKRLPVLKTAGVGFILVTAFCFVALLNTEVRRVEWTHTDSSDHPLP